MRSGGRDRRWANIDNDQNSPVPDFRAQSINVKEAKVRAPAELIPACGTTPRYVDE
jgi:hypothetical protein